MSTPIIFDRELLKIKRARAAKNFENFNFIHQYTAQDLVERLECTSRNFSKILDLGCNANEIEKNLLDKRANTTIIKSDISYEMLKNIDGIKIVLDEELIPFEPESFDLILSNLSLHNINDLPGTLIQIKNTLTKEGIFMCSIFGGTTLTELRQAMLETEIDLNIPSSAHTFPFIDIKDMGNLMQRVGFYMPAADSEIVTVTYNNVYKLMHDLRGMGQTNILKHKSPVYLGKKFFDRLDKIYKEKFSNEDGKIKVSFEIVTATGMKPL